jgi:hypothetical protein
MSVLPAANPPSPTTEPRVGGSNPPGRADRGAWPLPEGQVHTWPLRGRRSRKRLKYWDVARTSRDDRRPVEVSSRGSWHRAPSKGCYSLLTATPPAPNPVFVRSNRAGRAIREGGFPSGSREAAWPLDSPRGSL